MAGADFDQVVERNHAAVDEFARGNIKPLEQLYSRRDDVTLGNPFGPFVRCFDEVAETMERAATYYRDGKAIGFDLVAKEVTKYLASVVEVERLSSKIGDSEEETPVSLRVTSIFRNEDGEWKLLHRHADPITSPPPGRVRGPDLTNGRRAGAHERTTMESDEGEGHR